MRLIDEQPTVSTWIPRSERLPDANDICEVLAQQRDGSMNVITGLTFCNSEKIFVAWMPLPEPWKENPND